MSASCDRCVTEGQQLLEVQPGQTVDGGDSGARDATRASLYAQPNHVYHAIAVPNDAAFGQLWGQRNLGQTVNCAPSAVRARTPTQRSRGTARSAAGASSSRSPTPASVRPPDLAANISAEPGRPTRRRPTTTATAKVDDFRGRGLHAGLLTERTRVPTRAIYNEHGTHVAGTIGAVGNNVIGVAGMNWQVTLMPLRVLNSRGSGTSAAIADGFDYAGDHDARVVNASLGGSGDSDPAEQAAIAAHPNTLYVVAAGNDGTNNDGGIPHVPCNLTAPNLVCVAATTQSDGLASFSNRGTTSVDLGAPGHEHPLHRAESRPPPLPGRFRDQPQQMDGAVAVGSDHHGLGRWIVLADGLTSRHIHGERRHERAYHQHGADGTGMPHQLQAATRDAKRRRLPHHRDLAERDELDGPAELVRIDRRSVLRSQHVPSPRRHRSSCAFG